MIKIVTVTCRLVGKDKGIDRLSGQATQYKCLLKRGLLSNDVNTFSPRLAPV